MYGIKGRSLLSNLKYFNPVTSTCIDYMHSLLEGVIKNFFKYWFSPEYAGNQYSLRKYMQEIDNRLLNIKPPKYVPSVPRSIYTFNLWRAHEYLTFTIYYSIPVFHLILPFEYYQNLKKLVLIMETLLQKNIIYDNLNKIKQIIYEFIDELNYLYPEQIFVSGLHELLHLTDCTIQFGPLNSTNCFQYENLNRHIIGLIKSFDLIGEEFITNFSVAQILNSHKKSIKNMDIKNFVNKYSPFESKNEEFEIINSNMKELLNDNNSYRQFDFIEKYFSIKLNKIKIFNKTAIRGIFLTSSKIQTKNCDSCFIDNKNSVGLIEFFFEKNNMNYVLARRIVILLSPVYSETFSEFKSELSLCHLSDQYFIIELKDIQSKLVYIQTDKNDNGSCFISKFNCSHLFS